jgi:chromosome condensin MukBEF ATPase and DNA-binding subunit MukB
MNTIEVTYDEVERLIATERQLRAELWSVNEDLHHTRCERTCLRQENERLVAALQASANDLASLASNLAHGSLAQLFADESCKAATTAYRAALGKVQS